MASDSSDDFGFLVDGVACQDCGAPLPPAYIWRIATDSDSAPVVASVRTGTVNQVICPQCGCVGWISIPFLWVDHAHLRAVFVGASVWRHDQIVAERDRLVALALTAVDEAARNTLLSRLQEVREYRDIPFALARSDDDACRERAGLADFLAREGLPAPRRLERLLEDAERSGVVVMEGFESSTEFLELIRHEFSLLDDADDSLRAQGLRQTHAQLPPSLPHAAHPAASLPILAISDDAHLDLFASLLDTESKGRVDELLDDLLQADDSGAVLAALALAPAELEALSACAQQRLDAPGADTEAAAPQLELLVAALGSALAGARNRPGPLRPPPNDDTQDLVAIIEDSVSTPQQRLAALDALTLRELNKRRYGDAAALARRLVDLARSGGHRRLLANGLFFLGSALVGQGNPKTALMYLQEAHDLLIPEQLTEHAGTTLAHLFETTGDAYQQVGAVPLAARAYEAAASLFRQIGRPDGEHSNLERLAGACRQLGEHALAERHYRSALKCMPPDSEATIRTLCNLGDVLAGMARRPATIVEMLFTDTPAGGEPAQAAHARDDSATAFPAGALAQEDQLAFVEGLEDFKQGRAVFRAYMSKQAESKTLLFETIIGDEAVRCILDARRAAKRQGFAELELVTYAQLSNLFLRYDMRRAASDSVQMGNRRCAELGREPSLHALTATAVVLEDSAKQAWAHGDEDQANHAWTDCIALCDRILARAEQKDETGTRATGLKALSLEGLGQFDAAAKCYRAAITKFESRRRYLEETGHKLNLQAGSAILYPRAARNALALRRRGGSGSHCDALAHQAYALAEAARSRILLDSLAPIPGSPVDIGISRAILPMSAQQLSASLPAATAIVQYSLLPTYCGRKGCWAMFLVLPGADGVPLLVEQDLEQVLGAVEDVKAEVKRIESALGATRENGVPAGECFARVLGDHRQLDELLDRLGSLLLPAAFVESIIAHGVKRLVFVPEAYLMDVPFAALRVAWPEGPAYVSCGTTRRAEVLVMPSASAFIASWGQAQAPARSGLLCISDPGGDLAGVSEWIGKRLGATWKGQPVLQLAHTNAGRAAVEAAVADCDAVLYFGHGFYDERDPANSGLVLHDGLLSARRVGHADVARRLAGCRLFVIMACSGARVDVESEWAAREIQGLAAQLLGCGVDDVIGGIWPLISSFAIDFVDHLVDHMEQGACSSAAFTEALAAIVAGGGPHAHPYLWGAMRLSGAGRTSYSP